MADRLIDRAGRQIVGRQADRLDKYINTEGRKADRHRDRLIDRADR